MRVISRRGWKKLASGACIRTDDPDDEILIEVEKRARSMHTTEEVDRLVREHLRELAPGLDYNVALQKHYADPGLQELFALYPDPEPAPIAKAGPAPGDAAWSLIEKAAERVKAEVGDVLTREECIEEAMRRNPALYDRYRQEYLAGS